MKKSLNAVVLCLTGLLSLTGCDKAVSRADAKKQAQACQEKETADDYKFPTKFTVITDSKDDDGEELYNEFRFDADNYYFYTKTSTKNAKDDKGSSIADEESTTIAYLDGKKFVYKETSSNGDNKDDSQDCLSVELAQAAFNLSAKLVISVGSTTSIEMTGTILDIIASLDSASTSSSSEAASSSSSEDLDMKITKDSYTSSGDGNLTATFSGTATYTENSSVTTISSSMTLRFNNYLFVSCEQKVGNAFSNVKIDWNSCTITK
ncbi:MAG: hypothetical protein LKJ88_01635 [Bacilli bacterium]|jgi:hypothetical protein|nr:hypothetical protein [Bacilli bacterium]